MNERPYQLLPPLDDEQRQLLRQSIEANGVLEPVVFDEDGEILDGHHRVEIAEELGIEYPRRVIDGLDENGKQAYALTVNLARRQLTSATRSAHVMRLRQFGMSIRQIAEATGLSKTTVARDVGQLSQTGQLSQPERITGADGKSRASSRPAAAEPKAQPEAKSTTSLSAIATHAVAAAKEFDKAVDEFPELEHYADRPAKATALATQLRSFEPVEQRTRRETLAKVIQAEKAGRLTPQPDPTAEAIDRADRLFVAMNEAAQAAEKLGGIEAIEAAVAAADATQIELWREQFSDLAATLIRLAGACRPQLRRVQ